MKTKLIFFLLPAAVLLAFAASGSASAFARGKNDFPSSANSQGQSTQQIVHLDPAYTFDPHEVDAQFFGDYFESSGLTQRTEYFLLKDTPWQNTVVWLKGEQPGATVYLVASVHGDEPAGWIAAEQLKKIDIKKGNLYILAPANPWGMQESPPSRYLHLNQDLNRSFPGKADGQASEQIAAAIFADIKEKKPCMVLDLHEARPVHESQDFLGNSMVFTNLGKESDFFFNIIADTQAGVLCSSSFDYYTPAPKGSINCEVSQQLEIPTITVETFRGDPMEKRVADHLAIIEQVLRHYEIVN